MPSLAEQAADAIVAGIASGALAPGQRLVETELAALLNMSRVPLRESLRILETQGIVESVAHRGTRVAPYDAERVAHICEVRVALERIALVHAVQGYRADPSRLAILDRLIDQMARAEERMEWIEISQADLSFHREICVTSGHQFALTLWETLARHLLIIFGHEIRDASLAEDMAPKHQRLRDMLAAGDQSALHAEIEQHVMPFATRRGGAAP